MLFRSFLDEFWPKWVGWLGDAGRGCTSGHFEIGNIEKAPRHMHNFIKTAVYVSINNMQGCAEGIYHEVGHARLEALGLGIDNHDGMLILNTPNELYNSPIRKDKQRPMSAVIQAIYSWIIFSENDIQCASIPNNLEESANYLIGNLPKIEDGLAEIRSHVKCTAQGIDFMDGYFEWGEDVVVRGKKICQQAFGDNFLLRYNQACEYKNQ